jgi:hypothetical protein
MMLRYSLLLGCAAITLAGVANAQQGRPPARDDLLDAMTRHVQICAELTDGPQRLACYDKLQTRIGDVQAPAPARQPVPLATTQSSPTPSSPPPSPPPPPPPAFTGGSQVGNPTPLAPPPLMVPGGGAATLGSSQTGPTSLAPPQDDPDRAFNPRDPSSGYRPPEAAMPRPQPQLRRTGRRAVPNYGQPMPLVSLSASNLTYGDSRYWQVTVTVTSNVARDLDTQVRCSFLNAGRSVGEAYLGPVLMAPGEQISTELVGPPTNTFVDSTSCRVVSPQ